MRRIPPEKSGASGEIRTLKHLFLRQAAIPIRARWHMVHRGGFEPPRPTRGDRVTAGPFRPGSRTCAKLAEGRRIERPSLITTPWFSGPVADHSAVPSAWRRVRESNPLASCENPCLADKCLTVRPTLRQKLSKNSGRPGGIWTHKRAALEAAAYASSATGLEIQ